MTRPKSHTVEVEFTIRDYRPADFDRLWQIDQQCFVPGIAYTEMELMGFIGMRNAVALVAEGQKGPLAGQLAGFVVAHWRSKVGRIVTLDVLPEARRFGLASRLMVECETRLRAANCTQIYLETAVNNDPALLLYQKLGYEVLHTLKGYYSSQALDAFLMGKRLT